MSIYVDNGTSNLSATFTTASGSPTDIFSQGATALGTGKWWFIAISLAGVSASDAPKLYFGDLTTMPREDTYSNQQTGGGVALKNDAGDGFGLGNGFDEDANILASVGIGFLGRLARAMYFTEALTLEQIINLWRPQNIPPYEISNKLNLHAPLTDINNIRDESQTGFILTPTSGLSNADGPGDDASQYGGLWRRGLRSVS